MFGFQSENAIFKFFRRSVGVASCNCKLSPPGRRCTGGFILISDNRKLKAQNSVSMMSITNLNSKFFILLFIISAVRDYEMIRIFIENVHFLWMMLLSASDTILLTVLIIE